MTPERLKELRHRAERFEHLRSDAVLELIREVEEARTRALAEAAQVVRRHLMHNDQRAYSWHEAADTVEAILALAKAGAP